MKKIIHRIQDLGQKAGRLKDAAAGPPAGAGGGRGAVRLTAGPPPQTRAAGQAGVPRPPASNARYTAAGRRDLLDGPLREV